MPKARMRRRGRPKEPKEMGREERRKKSITQHRGVMEEGLGGGVGVVGFRLASCFATTSTTQRGGSMAVVGVLDLVWRTGCAGTSTAVE